MRKLMLVLLGVVFLTGQLLAQTRTISGRVTGTDGQPMANVSVLVKGTAIGTTTGEDGTYRLEVPASATTLVFSFVGRDPVEMQIGTSTTINAEIPNEIEDMTEFVVQVPYGTIKKTAFTGSEATVTTRSLEKQQLTSVTRALEGLVPGIITTNGGGDPGTNAAVVIRGFGSYSSSSAPLYVLNGVPYDGSIASLSMDEIESVTVLKDAAASALYGSRAANGVIMITTKTGKKGRPAVTATVRQGFMSRGIPEYDRVGIPEYYEMMWEATRNSYLYGSGLDPVTAGQNASNILTGPNGLVYNAYNVPGNQLVDPVTGQLNPNAQLLWNDSWEDALYRTAMRQNINLSVSGANDRNDYFFSAGYLNEEGIVKFSGYKRYNARLSLNTQATNWLRAGISLDGAIADDKNVPSGGTATTNPFYYTRQMGPIYPVWQRDASGNFIPDPAGGNMLDWGRVDQMGARPYAPNSNLLGSLALDDRNSRVFNGNVNSYLDVTFLRDFSFKTTFGVNYFNSYGTTYQNSQFGDADNVDGRSTKSNNRLVSYTINEVLSWNKSFGVHNVRALAGHENYKYNSHFVSATKTGFPFPGTSELDVAAVEEGSGSNENNLRLESYFGGVNYDYDNRYLASASIRRDGSSRFFPDNRWGTFYAAGLGWRISEEAFMQNVDFVNELKFRFSYGEMGNQEIGRFYAWQNLYALGWNNALLPGGIVGGLPSPDLKWEGNQTLNVGIDFAILNNRLQGTIEYFDRTSDDLIFPVPIPGSTGFTVFDQNVGVLKNTGVELQLGYNAVRARNVDWRIDVNLTHFKNEFTELYPGAPEDGLPPSGTKKIQIGKGLYDFWLREFAGVDPSTGDALYYKDILDSEGKPTGERTVTNVYTDGSYYYHGSAIPDLSGGITNSLRYKNFDLSILMTFAVGGKFYDGNYASLMHRGNYGTAWHADILERWQQPGDITNVPRVQNAVAGNDGVSTRFLFDADFLNIKNITLSYTLPRTLLSRAGISGVQIFGNIDNAYLFTKHKGMDPQRSFTGTSDWSFTPFRTITFGATVNL